MGFRYRYSLEAHVAVINTFNTYLPLTTNIITTQLLKDPLGPKSKNNLNRLYCCPDSNHCRTTARQGLFLIPFPANGSKRQDSMLFCLYKEYLKSFIHHHGVIFFHPAGNICFLFLWTISFFFRGDQCEMCIFCYKSPGNHSQSQHVPSVEWGV